MLGNPVLQSKRTSWWKCQASTRAVVQERGQTQKAHSKVSQHCCILRFCKVFTQGFPMWQWVPWNMSCLPCREPTDAGWLLLLGTVNKYSASIMMKRLGVSLVVQLLIQHCFRISSGPYLWIGADADSCSAVAAADNENKCPAIACVAFQVNSNIQIMISRAPHLVWVRSASEQH